MNQKVVILYSHDTSDNISPDNQDTLVQLAEITAILQAANYVVVPVAFNDQLDQLAATIKEVNPVCVFNLAETVLGANKLQYFSASFIEYLGYPYTGCSAWSLAALASKSTAKRMLRLANIPTPDFITLKNDTINEDILSAGRDAVDLNTDSYAGFSMGKGKWIIKPDTEHASFGLDINSVINLDLNSHSNLLDLLHQKNTDSGSLNWFAESFISGREFNVAIIDNGCGQMEVLTPVEMTLGGEQIMGDRIMDYASKWLPESADYELYQHKFDYSFHDHELVAKIMGICKTCSDLFGLKGAARIDLRVDADNNPWVVDINANPCLTSDAGLMVAAQRFKGLSQKDVILRLVATA